MKTEFFIFDKQFVSGAKIDVYKQENEAQILLQIATTCRVADYKTAQYFVGIVFEDCCTFRYNGERIT